MLPRIDAALAVPVVISVIGGIALFIFPALGLVAAATTLVAFFAIFRPPANS